MIFCDAIWTLIRRLEYEFSVVDRRYWMEMYRDNMVETQLITNTYYHRRMINALEWFKDNYGESWWMKSSMSDWLQNRSPFCCPKCKMRRSAGGSSECYCRALHNLEISDYTHFQWICRRIASLRSRRLRQEKQERGEAVRKTWKTRVKTFKKKKTVELFLCSDGVFRPIKVFNW